MNLKIYYESCPEKFRGGVQRFLEERIAPGHFLRAVLENDLSRAIGYADAESVKLLPILVSFVYNTLPTGAWGDKEKVAKWLAGGGL